MKLAFLCNNIKSVNGVERVLTQRLSLLAESGNYQVYLITYNQYGAPFSFPISDKVHFIDLSTRYIARCSFHGLFQYLDRFFSKIKYYKAIRDCFNAIKPDVITCIDIHIADLLAVLNLRIFAVKVVECHCGLSSCQNNSIIRTIRKFDRVVVMTDEEKNDWNLGDKVICIPNMLINYPDEIPNRKNNFHRVICVGRYTNQKGYDLLFAAWLIVQQKHPGWSLHIYGSHDGDLGDYDQLVEIKEKNQLHNVFLHPATNDVYSEYLKSDFSVMSSRYESFGLALIEAMSCGLPVVAFGCKYGPRSIVNDGETGILVQPSNAQKLAQSICYMIEHADERIRMGQKARTAVLTYKAERVMSIWHHFYQSVLCANA